MGKYKVSDGQIAELAQKGLSNNQIAAELGVSSAGTFHNRCNEIRKANGIPEWSGKMGRPFKEPTKPSKHAKTFKPAEKPKEPTERPKIKPIPFYPGEQAYYEGRLCEVTSVSADKITLRRYSDLSPIYIGMEEYIQNPLILRQIDEKPPIKTTGEAIVLKQTGKEYIKTVEVAETAKNFEPFDLEMGDNTDKVKDFGPIFEPIDYIDPEWGRKLTLREKIGKCIAVLFGEVEK